MQQSVGMLDSGSGARHYLLTWIRFSTGVSGLVLCKSVVICYALPPLTHEHSYFLSSLLVPRKRESKDHFLSQFLCGLNCRQKYANCAEKAIKGAARLILLILRRLFSGSSAYTILLIKD